jgi:DNA-binding transcriptional LysR family regulator
MISIGLRHLQFVVAAARYRSLRRAAEALRLKQSTLSRALHHLEERVGIVLFIRSNSGVRPTSAGLELVAAAERLIGDFDGLMAKAKALGRGAQGRITLGLPTSQATDKLCSVLIEYTRQRSDIDIRLTAKSKSALLADLYADALDIAVITGRVIKEEIDSISLWSSQIFLAVLETHALTVRSHATWSDMAEEIVLSSSEGLGPELKEILSAKLAAIGRQPTIDEHSIDSEALLNLVAAGRGVALQCENVVQMSHPGLKMLELHDEAGPVWISYSACWKRDSNNPALPFFLSLLRRLRFADSLRAAPDT